MTETEVSDEFEVRFRTAGYAHRNSLVDAGKWLPARWQLRYVVDGDGMAVALYFPTRQQAEIALRICKHLGITPAVYEQAANSPEGSGELRRRIMELFPW